MDEYSHKDVTLIGRFNCFTFNSSNVCLILPLQSVNATHALKRSAGVSKFNVSLGRSFN